MVLFARAAMLLAAAALVAFSLTLAAQRDAARTAAEHYACPMHPEVTSPEAGECPVCKMALERLDGDRDRNASSCSVADEPSLAGPAAAAVVAQAAGPPSPLGVSWLPETFPASRAPGTSASPALATPRFRTFHDAARAPAWAEAPDRLAALFYRDELVGLKSRERVTFFRALAPRTPIPAELDDAAPELWDGSTVLVHFVLPRKNGANPANDALRTGDIGFVELEARPRELLVVPESAVLRSSEGAYVLVAGTRDEPFARRPIELGRSRRGYAVIVSGLRETDRVVVGNAFFHDVAHAEDGPARAIAGVGP